MIYSNDFFFKRYSYYKKINKNKGKDKMKDKTYKYEGKTFMNKRALYDYIEENKKEELEKLGWEASRYWFFVKYGKKEGKSVISGKPTKWNPVTEKYERFNEDEKEEYVRQFQERMKGKYGITHLTKTPEQQKKMLSNRSIGTEYRWRDNSVTMVTGTYEHHFLHFLEFVYNFKKEYLSEPPTIYYREKLNSDERVLGIINEIKDVKLFGSRMNGNYRPDSDVDVVYFILGNEDYTEIDSSAFHEKNIKAFNEKRKEIQNRLGKNPDTGEPYNLQLVGMYEIRNFKIDEVFRDKVRFYLPDFFIPSLNLIVEVKGSNGHYQERDAYKEELKQKATIDEGFDFVQINDKHYSSFNRFFAEKVIQK